MQGGGQIALAASEQRSNFVRGSGGTSSNRFLKSEHVKMNTDL